MAFTSQVEGSDNLQLYSELLDSGIPPDYLARAFLTETENLTSPLDVGYAVRQSSYLGSHYLPFRLAPIQYLGLAVFAVPFLLSFHPRSMVRRVLYLLPLVLLLEAYRTPGKVKIESTGAGYQFGLLLASLTMRILDRFYLNDPEATFLRTGVDDKEGQGPITYKPIKKFFWALELITVTRGIGWNWQISQIPERPRLARGPFLLMKLRKALSTYAGLRFVIVSSNFLLSLAQHGPDATMAARASAALLHPLILQLYIYASWVFVVYGSLSWAENILAIIFVGLGITERWSEPAAWPSTFGSIKDSYGFRRSWGIWWHQNLRRTCGSLGNFVVQNVPCLKKPKSKRAVLAARYIRVLSTFFVSAFIHFGGSLYVSQRAGGFDKSGNFRFFFLHSTFAVVVEDVVYWLMGLRDKEPCLAHRLLGYAAVHSYAAYTIPSLKVIPLGHDLGLEAPGHPLMVGVKMAGLGARGVLQNPFAALFGSLNP